jgi:hypothetical protein
MLDPGGETMAVMLVKAVPCHRGCLRPRQNHS